jgi:single-strand DNA-binding protein
MAYPFPPRSVQVTNQAHFNVAEFEPLLDSNEAAALLRIHPKTLQKLARRGEIKGSHVGKRSPCVTRAGSGNSTNGDRIMYQNKVNLIGFLGSDAEVRTANNHSFTTLSLATKSSYKDKSGQYVSHTEWHRCVVFGKLSEFAGTLTKGAHVQVEGELRSRQYDSKKTDAKQRIWEIRVDSILKLDRAEKASPEEQKSDNASDEEPAA